MQRVPPDGSDLFSEAVRHHQAGRLPEAERAYQQILTRDPGHADSLHLLGVTAYGQGRRNEAVEMLRRAILIDDRVAAYHSNLGNMLKACGQRDEAMACYRRAVALDADFVDAHYNLAIALAEQGALQEALGCFRTVTVLRPDFAAGHVSLGNLLRQLGQPDEAVAAYRKAVALQPEAASGHYLLANALAQQGQLEAAVAGHRRAIELKPDFLEASNNLANLLKEQGKLVEAIACYRRILQQRPDFAEIANNLGTALCEHGQVDEAVDCYRSVIAQRPDFAEAHNNLGNALDLKGQSDEAIACFRKALALKPDFPRAQYNLGNMLREQRRMEEAAQCYRSALELRPAYPEACNNLGNVLREQGRLDDAADCLRQAIALRPDFAEAHANLGITLLAQGDMAAGWEAYEWRWKTPSMRTAQRSFSQPQWFGEAGRGRTLLIHAEQGLGDTIQFCRYAPLAAARDLRIILEVQPPLVRLLGCLPGVDLVLGRGERLPEFDLHCPMLSLPLAFATTPATIPAPVGYLRADQAQADAWQARLAAQDDPRMRIGLVWAGSSTLPSDARRSLAPERLAPLAKLPDVHLYSLQKFGPAAPEDLALTDFMAEVQDFGDTAALVENLDLVISVDTAVAHLAAALGKPVWLLDRFDPDWRWVGDQRQSIWYPTLRIFRQPSPNAWDVVMTEVAHALRGFTPDDGAVLAHQFRGATPVGSMRSEETPRMIKKPA